MPFFCILNRSLMKVLLEEVERESAVAGLG